MSQSVGARITDDLFVIAHRDRDGKPLLPARVLGLAMAGAMLCELALAGRVGVRDGDLVVTSDAPLADELMQSVLRQVLSQPTPLPVRDWLDYLASGTPTAVGHRLANAGTVEARKRRRGWRFVPVDSTAAFFKAGRLAVMLDNATPFTPAQAALVGLVDAAGLLEELPCVSPAAARSRVDAVVQSLEWPLDGLVAETAAAVDKAIITRRT